MARLFVTEGIGPTAIRGVLRVLSGSVTEKLDGNDQAEFQIEWPAPVAVGFRTPLRLVEDDGRVSDWRVGWVKPDLSRSVADLRCVSPLVDLTFGGTMRQAIGGGVEFRFAGTYPLSTWLTTFGTQRVGAPISQWLSPTLGTIESDPELTLEFENQTYLQFFRLCAAASRQELALERQPTGIYRLAMYGRRGSSVPVTRVAEGLNQLRRDTDTDFEGVASVILPFGDATSDGGAPATIAENAWVATSIDSDGWVTLRGVGGTPGPVRLDGQFREHGAGWFTGSVHRRSAIVDSRAADSAVRLATPTGLTTGMMVTLYADAMGTPLLEVQNPDLLVTDVGRIERQITITGGRGERNYLTNPELADGSTGWVMGAHGAVVARARVPRTLTPLAKGARAADTPVSTPFQMDGLATDEPVYEGDCIESVGARMTIDTDAIPAPDGSLSVHVDVGLPGALPDGATLVLQRRRRRVFTVDGTQSIMGRGLIVDAGGDTDGLFAGRGDVLGVSADGRGTTLSVAGVVGRGWNGGAIGAVDAGSGRLRFGASAGVMRGLFFSTAAPGTYQSFVIYTIYFDPGSGRWKVNVMPGQAAVLAAMTPGVSTCQIGGWPFVLYATNGVGDAGGETDWELAPGALLPGESAPTTVGGWSNTVSWSDVTIADGTSLYLDEVREDRPLQLQGAHPAGAQTLVFRPTAELARRDFATTDQLYLERMVSFTMRVTGIVATEIDGIDGNGEAVTYWENVLTLDLANSTIDEIPDSEWAGRTATLFRPGGGLARTIVLQPLSGSTMTVFTDDTLAAFMAPMPVTFTVDLAVVDSYAIGSPATWGTNGRATVAVSIPAGRSYAAGARVWTSFHPVGVGGMNFGPDASLMRLVNAVTGAASSVLVEGADDIFRVGNQQWEGIPNATPPALWRIVGDAASDQQSRIDIASGLLFAAATALPDGSGTAQVTLREPNAVAIADNQTLRILRPTIHGLGEAAGGNFVRLLGPTWRTADMPWTLTPPCYIEFPPGATSRRLTATVWFVTNIPSTESADTALFTVGVLAANGAVIGQGQAGTITHIGQAQLHRLTTQVTITAPGVYRIGVQGGRFGYNLIAGAVRAMLSVSASTDIPFTRDSLANAMLLRAQDELEARAASANSVVATLARFVGATGVVPTAAALTPGAEYFFAETGETLRLLTCKRAVHGRDAIELTLDRPRRTVESYLGQRTGTTTTTSTVVSGGGSGGGTGSGSVPPLGITVTDRQGNSVADVRTLDVDGLSVAANGTNRATLTIIREADMTLQQGVLAGGDWVPRDLVTSPSYQITVTAGRGIIEGRTVLWPQTTVTCPAANGQIYVDASGTVRVRAAGSPEQLPAQHAELLLWRTFVDISVYGPRIYAIVDSRTYQRLTPRAPLYLRERVEAAKITSGTWAGATAVNDIGNLNWYFANLGLYPFVEELPTQVLDHLNVQITKFAHPSTGTGATDWTALHGTAHSDQYQWWYDVHDPRGTPSKVRADSHDSYCATFLRLAVRYARTVPGGLAWWDANITPIQEAIYRNHLIRQRLVNGGAGYLNETFQDPAVYPFCQTLDNVEVYRGLKDALDLMTARGGAQATWAAGYAGTVPNILAGIQSMWSEAANALGDTKWLSVAWDNAANAKLVNEMTTFYPGLTIGVPAAVFDVPLHGTPSIAMERLSALFDHLNGKAPGWFATRRYDLYPWGIVAAAATKVGYRDIGEAWLSFVQRHQARDAVGYFQIQDIGWARYIERLLEGERL